MDKNKTLYVCRQCDRVYYSVSREAWEADREKHDQEARKARRKHLCPWKKAKQKKNKSSK